MTEVEAVMVRDSRAGKPDASVRTSRIRNLLAFKNKQKNALLPVAAKSGSEQQTFFPDSSMYHF